jgi:hypothetical protein
MAVHREEDPERAAAVERVWPARLRWRLKGAWQWPTFVVMTAVDAVVLAELPFSGEDGSLMGSLLGAGFLNLAIVAVLAPLGGAALRRRRPTLPRAVASDRVGTALLVALGLGFLAGGIANRGHVDAAHDRFDAGVAAARHWFAVHAPTEYAAHLGEERVWSPGPSVMRVCLPGPDPDRNFCVWADVSTARVRVARDRDEQPNSVVAGPDNPGRRAR